MMLRHTRTRDIIYEGRGITSVIREARQDGNDESSYTASSPVDVSISRLNEKHGSPALQMQVCLSREGNIRTLHIFVVVGCENKKEITREKTTKSYKDSRHKEAY